MFALLSISEITQVLEMVRELIIEEHLSIFTKVASVLAATLAAWSYIKVSHDYMEGQGVTFWSFLKPLVMVILVCNFNTFILHPIHYVTNVFTKDLTLRTNEAQSSLTESMRNLFKSSESSDLNPLLTLFLDDSGKEDTENAGTEVPEEPTFWERTKKVFGGIYASINRIPTSINKIVHVSLSAGIYTFLKILMTFFYYCQVCLSYILLTIYGLLGPFVFSFSILNGYSKGVSDWIARYIHTSFWVPVGQIILLIGSIIMDNISSIINPGVGHIDHGLNTLTLLAGNTNIGSWLGIILIVATLTSLMQVPKICSYIIESAGSGGVESSVGRTVGGGARLLTRIFIK